MANRILIFILLAVFLTSCGIFEDPYDDENADLPDVDIEITDEEERLTSLVNEERNNHSLDTLISHPALVLVARKHSEDMRDRDFFNHVNPDGKKVSDRAEAEGIAYQIIGENIAWVALSVGLEEDPLAMVVSNWMKSDSHRKMILNVDVTHTGVGIAVKNDEKNSETKYYFTQVFLKPR